jgi:membrane protease YdiL (CAAX protease family)
LNRHRLASLNIDRPLLIALLIGGFFYLVFLTLNIGLLIAIATGFVFWAYQNNHFVLKNTIKYPPETIPLILFSVLLAVLPIILFNLTLKQPMSFQRILTAFTSTVPAQLALIVFEEVIFRGALWAYLRDLGVKEHIAFLVQAFLFWIAHSRYMFLAYPYLFWIAIPLVSLLLGFIVWRSKSLTPSTIAHLLFNSTGAIIRSLF